MGQKISGPLGDTAPLKFQKSSDLEKYTIFKFSSPL